MGDLVIFFVWIVGLVLAAIVIVAQFQLFAIRRLLEALVKQSGSADDPGAAAKIAPSSIETEPAARSRGAERALYIGLALAIFAVVAWVVLH